jgi:hypothetical protein
MVARGEPPQMTEMHCHAGVREALSGAELFALPVEFSGIYLGRPVDLGQRRVLALELHCGDEARRYLPFPVARIEPERIAVGSPLVLIDADATDFYREHAETLRRLRGAPVERSETELGELDDVIVLTDGQIVELVVKSADGGVRRVPLDDRTHVGGARPVLR